jgi:8-oxo-dGTP pyrophosphatase MutT (NUDIX family)
MKQLATTGLVVIKDRNLLLTFSKNKKAWYLPGGKVDSGESPVQALMREILEELNILLEPGDLAFYMHITALAFGESPSVLMEQDCYRCDLPVAPQAQGEIEKISYFSTEMYKIETPVPGVILLMEQLKIDGLID